MRSTITSDTGLSTTMFPSENNVGDMKGKDGFKWGCNASKAGARIKVGDIQARDQQCVGPKQKRRKDHVEATVSSSEPVVSYHAAWIDAQASVSSVSKLHSETVLEYGAFIAWAEY